MAITFKPTKSQSFVIPIILVTLLIILFILVGQLALLIVGALFIIWFISENLEVGWYGLVFLSPFFEWTVRLSDYSFIINSWPQLAGIYAPAVEFWAIAFAIAFAVRLFNRWLRGEVLNIYMPALGWYALFIISAFTALLSLYKFEWVSSIKFIFHYHIFLYFLYIVLGVNFVNSKQRWQTSLKVLAGAGLLGALMGLTSLVLGVWQDGVFSRAVPFAIGGWAPLGDQHIFLAELLTTTLPIYLYFWKEAITRSAKQCWGGAAVFVFLIGLLTLSRAGWLTMAFEALVFSWLIRPKEGWLALFKRYTWMLIILIPISVYWLFFVFYSAAVASSNMARWYFADFALYLFLHHPFIGNGVGSFVTQFGLTRVLTLEFGPAVDAHGLLQKIAAEQGLFGLISFGIFIGWIFWRIYQRYQDEHYIIEARLAAFVSFFLALAPLVFQMFNTQYYTSVMWVPFALAIAQCILYQTSRVGEPPVFNLKLKRHRVITKI